jgi:dihydroorotase
MSKTIIRNAQLVNEGTIQFGDVLINGQCIEKIDSQIQLDPSLKINEVNAEEKLLFPGVIDAQVHFREPGLTHKADLFSESIAAVAGGVTSFMDMPNTNPATLSQSLLEEKYQLAAQKSIANFSFFMGISQDNLEEVLRTDNETVCGVSDDGLYFNYEEGILANFPDFLEVLFARCESLVALHSEDDQLIAANTNLYKSTYGLDIPVDCHPKIRSKEACVQATKRIIEIAEKHNTRLHVLHVSTADETKLFKNNIPLNQKRITAEASTHHLFFSDQDYQHLGNKIKWNPAIKSEADRKGLIKGLLNQHIDIITTDHAPHLWQEKEGNYFEAKSGGPLVQHSLQAIIELSQRGEIPLEKIPEKMSHHVAELYKIKNRGYIREGYYADLVLVDLAAKTPVNKTTILSKCNWSPFENKVFNSQITHTWVNGNLAYHLGSVKTNEKGKRLLFEKHR